MGLGKFVAGRIHQMRSGESYLAAHTSWENPNPETTCSRCSDAPQSFEHAILTCPLSAWQRSRLLQGLPDLGPEAPIWTDQQGLIGLAEFIRVTAIRFPPLMPLLSPSVHAPLPNPFLASTSLPAPSPWVRFAVYPFLLLTFSCSGTCIGRVGGTGYELFFCSLLFDLQFCFDHIDKMHAISYTVETINIWLKKEKKKKRKKEKKKKRKKEKKKKRIKKRCWRTRWSCSHLWQ